MTSPFNLNWLKLLSKRIKIPLFLASFKQRFFSYLRKLIIDLEGLLSPLWTANLTFRQFILSQLIQVLFTKDRRIPIILPTATTFLSNTSISFSSAAYYQCEAFWLYSKLYLTPSTYLKSKCNTFPVAWYLLRLFQAQETIFTSFPRTAHYHLYQLLTIKQVMYQ